jgi:AmmeMemoRadiSam system protein B
MKAEAAKPAVVRSAAVAGRFYPDDPTELRQMIEGLLGRDSETTGPVPKALIVPHAGYAYSGPVAASAYSQWRPVASQITRVVILGPSHYAAFDGLASSNWEVFLTPLGPVPVWPVPPQVLAALPQVHSCEKAHRPEHCLEVQLPFLQVVLRSFSIVPLLVGRAEVEEVAEVLEALWGGPETGIIVSSDLSHYLDSPGARGLDRETAESIERLDFGRLGDKQACGAAPIRGLLKVASTRGLAGRTLDLRNSGDTDGPRDRVVGYGAFAFQEQTRDAERSVVESQNAP